MRNLKVDFNKIEEIKISLGYSSQQKFAEDCWVKNPTYLAVKETGTSGIKFLNWLNALLKKNGRKELWIDYFIIK